jgi:hypothetical protein
MNVILLNVMLDRIVLKSMLTNNSFGKEYYNLVDLVELFYLIQSNRTESVATSLPVIIVFPAVTIIVTWLWVKLCTLS